MTTSEQRAQWLRLANAYNGSEILGPPVTVDLCDAVNKLVAEVEQVRAERNEARAWAWAHHHRVFSGASLPYRIEEGGTYPGQDGDRWDWIYPDWLLSSIEPHEQSWWKE